MMIKKYYKSILLLLFILILDNYHAQVGHFLTGFARESINPSQDFLSLPISGFENPKGGRFSIDFVTSSTAENIVALSSGSEKLYAATSDNALLVKVSQNANINQWENIGSAYNITAIAHSNGKLYSTDKNNILWSRDDTSYNIPWSNIGYAYDITAMTAVNNKLYAINKSNKLLVKDLKMFNSNWQEIGSTKAIRSLTNDGSNLIALSKYDNDLWMLPFTKSTNQWYKIGTPNDITYKSYFTNIAFDKKLFLTSDDDKLYYSQHNEKPIYANVSYFEKKQQKALIISLDLCGIDYSFSKEIKHVLKKEYDIDEDYILINCTHTHFAPLSQTSFSCMQDFYQQPNLGYLSIVREAILTATRKAIAEKKDNKLSYYRSKTNIGYNRADNSKPIDDNITMVISESPNSKNINGILISASAHPVWANSKKEFFSISPNYIGSLTSQLSILKNTQNVSFLQGCAGDINPNSKNTADVTANKLLQDFSSIKNASTIQGDITAKFDSISIPLNNFKYDKLLKILKDNIDKHTVESERNVRWANKIINQYDTHTLPKTMTVYIQILKIGDWTIIAFSREAVSQYAINLYKYYSNQKLSILSYSNDVSSYLPVEWHIKKDKPNYEGFESFIIYGQSGIPVNNVETLITNKVHSMMQ